MTEIPKEATKDPPPAVNGNGVKPQLHQTHLSMLSRCGIQFQRRYGALFGIWPECEVQPPGIALVTGIAVHKAVEGNLRNKIDNGTLLPVDHVRELAAKAFQDEWNGGVMLTPDETVNVKTTFATNKDQTVALAAIHAAVIAPGIRPVAVEEPFVIEMEGYPIDLAGQIDVREAEDIRDTKTAKAKPSANAARTIQTATYALGYQVQHGQLPSFIHIDSLVKTKIPQAITISAVPDDSWMPPVLNRIERFIEIIEAVKEGKQTLTPANPDGPMGWMCSRRWCGYADTCPFFSGREG